jgi:tetraacyldisaccharide 4'-kinase
VGNLTLGGTGKTPLVAWVAQELASAARGVTLISRGYGGRSGEPNDEARELALRLPGVPHLQNPDRIAAAQAAQAVNPRHVFVLDDAFQHRRIARDLDLVLIDALEPFGFDHLFPRGTLREPLSGLRRADAVILTRADLVSADERAEIQRRVVQFAPSALWVETAFRPLQFRNPAGDIQPVSRLAGQPVIAFCGIGNPGGFAHTLANAGLNLVELKTFPDHQTYGSRELAALADFAHRHSEAKALLCTMKDLVKLRVTSIGSLPIWALEIDVAFLHGGEALRQRLQAAVKDRFDALHSAT